MIKIKSRSHNYKVDFIDRIDLVQILNDYDLCIIDENVAQNHYLGENMEKRIFLLPSELNKDMETVLDLLEKFAIHGLNRTSKVICIGGGILQDICTIASSIYMRGIDWDFVPSTLQAMTDSCIGGKSSINLATRKNLIGNYYPPKNIFIDCTLVTSLEYRDIQCGLFEMLKINMVESSSAMENFHSLFASIIGKTANELDIKNLKELISSTLQLKANIVSKDEFDLGVRKLLNFGHTFAHAFEEISNYQIPHGHAVGLGMICAVKYSVMVEDNKIDKRFVVLVQTIKKIFTDSDREYYGKYLDSLESEEFSRRMLGDKKAVGHLVSLIIPINKQLDISKKSFNLEFLDGMRNTLKAASLELEN
jgi:3-dehydroquinate synthase